MEWAVGLFVVVLVLGPLLWGRGLSVIGDMVFVPEQPWKAAWIGADGGVPRAVPGDAVVSVLSQVVGGEWVQRLALGGMLLAGFLGTCRLVASFSLSARLAAALCFVWNPFVWERLAIGHWALLCGYAALPWIAAAALRLRQTEPHPEPLASLRRRRAWAVLLAGFVVAGWMSPTGGVLTVLTALVLLAPRWREMIRSLALGVVVNLPWILPAFLNGSDQLAPDPFGVTAFAARADSPWGVLGSLFTFGGMWKESVLPAQRQELFFAVCALLLALIALGGVFTAAARRVIPLGHALVLTLTALVLSVAGAWEFTRPLAEWVVAYVPGGGLVRDAQKWVAPWALVAAVGFGAAVDAVRAWGLRRGSALLALPLVLLPPVALPSMGFMLGGLLPVAPFPAEWSQVRAEMERRGVTDEPVVVLPFSTYRQFSWTPRPVLDPAPRFFPGTMVVEDALTVPEGTVGGESALAARVREAQDPETMRDVLTDAGVGWILVHAGREVPVLPEGAVLVLGTDQLSFYATSEAVLEGTAPWMDDESASQTWRLWVYGLVDGGVALGSLILAIWLVRAEKSSQKVGVSAYTHRSVL